MGTTTRKEIKTDRFSDPIQISARMTKEATGTDRIISIGGFKNSFTRGKAQPRLPRRIPRQKALKNPRQMRREEWNRLSQKSPSFNSPASVSAMSKGPAKIILLWMKRSASCQIPIQISQQTQFFPYFFIRFFIEAIRKGSCKWFMEDSRSHQPVTVRLQILHQQLPVQINSLKEQTSSHPQ